MKLGYPSKLTLNPMGNMHLEVMSGRELVVSIPVSYLAYFLTSPKESSSFLIQGFRAIVLREV